MARPTKAPKPGTQQVTVSLRVPVELKAALEERAAANHRNLSQEAERTLERSFSSEALFADVVRLVTQGSRAEDRFTDAAGWVRTLAHDVFGVRIGEVGFRLMQAMAVARMLTNTGMLHVHAAHPDDIEYFLAAIRELQGNTDRADQQVPTGPGKDDPSDVAPPTQTSAPLRSTHRATKTTAQVPRSTSKVGPLTQDIKRLSPRSNIAGEFKHTKARVARRKVEKP
jgi:hypothetical protein